MYLNQRKTRTPLSVIAALILCCSCYAMPSRQSDAGSGMSDTEERLRHRLEELAAPFVDPAGVPGKAVGLVIGVTSPGVRAVAGVGETAIGSATTPGHDTIFEIGSVTKVFTGYLLAKAIRSGEIRLEDSIAPVFPKGTPHFYGRSITMLDLATHYSGLPSYPNNMHSADPANPMAGYTVEDLATYLSTCQSSGDCGPSGLRYRYSNLGVGTLSQVLIQVSQPRVDTYEGMVKRDIASLLGLDDTVVSLLSAQQARRAQGYDDGQPQPLQDSGLHGGGALRSTAKDMLDFLEPALGNGPADAIATWKVVLEPRRPNPQLPAGSIGLLLNINDAAPQRMYAHSGGTAGFSSFIAFTTAPPAAVVVLSNAKDVHGLYELAMKALDELSTLP